MASNIDVTLKRYNGTDYDKILPVTHLGQLYTDDTLTTTLNDYLVANYINTDQLAAANGVATLDANQKLTLSQLPTGIAGGLKFRGSLSTATDLDTLGDLYTSAEVGEGSYWIATADIVLTSTAHSVVQAPGDEGDSTFPITIEAGDWVLLTAWDTDDYTFGILNNTYQDATTTAKGITRLSSISTLNNVSGNNVVTDGVLQGLKVADGTDLADGVLRAHLLAPAIHNHDSSYYQQSQVAAFFAGTTSITGYNKSNWDTAYGDKVDSVDFNTNTGELTLNRQDTGTVTVNLNGRYTEYINGGPGVDVQPTGNEFTISHQDTSSQASVDNSNGSVIQDITLDGFGHITALGSVDLDGRYYTETEVNAWLDGPVNGTALDGHYFTEILYGASPTATTAGTIVIDIA